MVLYDMFYGCDLTVTLITVGSRILYPISIRPSVASFLSSITNLPFSTSRCCFQINRLELSSVFWAQTTPELKLTGLTLKQHITEIRSSSSEMTRLTMNGFRAVILLLYNTLMFKRNPTKSFGYQTISTGMLKRT